MIRFFFRFFCILLLLPRDALVLWCIFEQRTTLRKLAISAPCISVLSVDISLTRSRTNLPQTQVFNLATSMGRPCLAVCFCTQCSTSCRIVMFRSARWPAFLGKNISLLLFEQLTTRAHPLHSTVPSASVHCVFLLFLLFL